MAKRIVDVLVPVALDQTYSYRVPPGLELAPGDLVRVPLGPRECTAVVWANDATPDPRLDNRLKDVAAKLDIPPLKPELRKFVEWYRDTRSAARHGAAPALRMGEHLGPERVRVGVRIAGPPPQRMTAARARVLALLADGLARAKGDAAREAGVSVGVIDGLIDEGTLEAVALCRRSPPPGRPTPAMPFPISRPPRPRQVRCCATACAPAATPLRCSTASPARARPRFISRRWRRRYRAAARA
jgi:primosomal protein N' (replication factor Y)